MALFYRRIDDGKHGSVGYFELCEYDITTPYVSTRDWLGNTCSVITRDFYAPGYGKLSAFDSYRDYMNGTIKFTSEIEPLRDYYLKQLTACCYSINQAETRIRELTKELGELETDLANHEQTRDKLTIQVEELNKRISEDIEEQKIKFFGESKQ